MDLVSVYCGMPKHNAPLQQHQQMSLICFPFPNAIGCRFSGFGSHIIFFWRCGQKNVVHIPHTDNDNTQKLRRDLCGLWPKPWQIINNGYKYRTWKWKRTQWHCLWHSLAVQLWHVLHICISLVQFGGNLRFNPDVRSAITALPQFFLGIRHLSQCAALQLFA